MDDYGLSINKKGMNNRALRASVDAGGLICDRDGRTR
jgi:hypothetical protein